MKTNIYLAQVSPTLGNLEKNLEICTLEIKKAILQNAGLIVFPELALTGYYLKDLVDRVSLSLNDKKLTPIIKLSQKIDIVISFVEEDEQHRLFISAAYLSANSIIHVHRKVYLPTYGMFEDRRYFTSGHSFVSFETKLGKVSLLICEDAWHLEAPLIAALEGTQYIIVISSSPVQGISKNKLVAEENWGTILKTYALLLGAYVIYVNRVGCEDGVTFWGGSFICGPDGVILGQAKIIEADALSLTIDSAEIKRQRQRLPLIKEQKMMLLKENLDRIDDRS